MVPNRKGAIMIIAPFLYYPLLHPCRILALANILACYNSCYIQRSCATNFHELSENRLAYGITLTSTPFIK